MSVIYEIDLGTNQPLVVSKRAKELFDEVLTEVGTLSYGDTLKLSDKESWSRCKNAAQDLKEEISLIGLRAILPSNSWTHKAEKRIFKLPFSKTESPNKTYFNNAFKMLESYGSPLEVPSNELLFLVKEYFKKFGKDKIVGAVIEHFFKYTQADERFNKFWLAIDKMIRGINGEYPFFSDDVLGKYILNYWDGLKLDSKEVFEFCFSQPQKSKPTKTWLENAKKLAGSLEEKENIKQIFIAIFEYITVKNKELVKYFNGLQYRDPNRSTLDLLMNGIKLELEIELQKFDTEKHEWYLLEENEIGVAYLTWFAALLNDEKVNTSIIDLGISSFGKIRSFGNISTKIGNAALLAFTYMPEKQGVVGLLTVKNKTQNKNVLKLADNHLKRKAAELNLSEEALTELAAPDFGLNKSFQIIKPFENFEAIIETTNIKKPQLFWRKQGEDKLQKSVPTSIKTSKVTEIKELKKLIKSVQECFTIHSRRLENTYLDRVEWNIKDWEKYYITHPLLSKYSGLLIWQFDENKTAILFENEWVDSSGELINISDVEKVRLWHPIYSDEKVIETWRNFIFENEIKQPFKQAFREIYIVTDAELQTETYSNRFAAHIIKQHQFLQLCKLRRWNYRLQGGFDSYNTPEKLLPKWNARVEFFAEPVEDSLSDSNIFLYLSTDQVRFYIDEEQAQMRAIPSMLFSEMMRDVDLYVGVCSIGNDDRWEDGGGEERYQNYWQNTSFGDLTENAKMRKTVLEKILPKLKIASKTKIEGKFLLVEGKIRNYKIHLGSGNTLMSPHDQYLCIVPGNSNKANKIFLPFDDDRTLSIILSKAFLLIADDKIKDPTIIRQIKK